MELEKCSGDLSRVSQNLVWEARFMRLVSQVFGVGGKGCGEDEGGVKKKQCKPWVWGGSYSCKMSQASFGSHFKDKAIGPYSKKSHYFLRKRK